MLTLLLTSLAFLPLFQPVVVDGYSLEEVKALYKRYAESGRTHGDGTYYGEYGGGGKCSIDPRVEFPDEANWITVAAGPENYKGSLGCGMCVSITGTGEGSGGSPITGTYKAVVNNECSECEEGSLDFGKNGDGRWKISSIAIPCPVVGNIRFKFQGSNPWYLKLQVANAKIPAAGLEILNPSTNKYQCMKKTPDNFFTYSIGQEIKRPLHLRITSISGQRVKASIAKIDNNDPHIDSGVQFGGIHKGCGPHKIKCFGQGMADPYPAEGMP